MVVPVPKPHLEPFPANVMVKCPPLPLMPDQITVGELVDQSVGDTAEYNVCKSIHNTLIDLIEKRLSEQR